MSRKQALLIILVVAVIIAVVLHLAAGGGFDPVNGLPAVLGKAAGFFIFPGVLPCIVWACMKFRRRRLVPIMTSWIVLQIVFAVAVYYDMTHGPAAG
ncbi:MAG TPA: hypothetical protein VM639_09180 [Dongiaceae bacterium]|nr:hypothetical protein [Dongiaceae bacterium]